MQITEDDIRRFQEIWREEFGEELSPDEARHHIGRLDALYILLYGPQEMRRAQLPAGQEEDTPTE